MEIAHRSDVYVRTPSAPDLEAAIDAAERAVVARDLRIRHRAGMIATRMADHWPLALGITVGAAFLLGRALSPVGHGRTASAVRKAVGPNAPLWRLLPLLWPLLPRSLRARVPSGTVALLSNIAATLTGGLKPGRKG